ncbi:hypothetical protein V8G54_021974, partial [Vigna mungo]
LWCCRLHHVSWQEACWTRCSIHFGEGTRRRRRRMRHRPCLRGQPRMQGFLWHDGSYRTILMTRDSERRIVLENRVVTNEESEVKEMDLGQEKVWFWKQEVEEG